MVGCSGEETGVSSSTVASRRPGLCGPLPWEEDSGEPADLLHCRVLLRDSDGEDCVPLSLVWMMVGRWPRWGVWPCTSI